MKKKATTTLTWNRNNYTKTFASAMHLWHTNSKSSLVKRSLHVVFLVIVLLLTSELVVIDAFNQVLSIVNTLSHKCDNKYSQSGVIQYYELKSA